MRCAVILTIAVVAAVGLAIFISTAAELTIWDYSGKLVVGEWAWRFDTGGAAVAEAQEFNGFAYGPGRAEIAYCARDEAEGPSKLRIVTTPVRERYGRQHPARPGAPARLLWTAPDGLTLRGPIWWAPNGTAIALPACSHDTRDLVLVDYVTGEPTWLTRGESVVDVAWRPDAAAVACVTEGDEGRTVWLQSVPPTEARRMGRDGRDLRWTVDGAKLLWRRADSESAWTRMAWLTADETVTELGPTPVRPAGAVWSPDGSVCAALEPEADGRQSVVIYPAESRIGDTVELPGVEPVGLLGFSPDGSVMLLLARGNRPIAVSTRPIPPQVGEVLPTGRGHYSPARGVVAGFPMKAGVGPPSWCTTGHHLLAYVAGEQPRYLGGMHAPELAGKLVVGSYQREYLGGPAEAAAKVERQQLDWNLKNIALAFQMYFADNNDIFPQTAEMPDVRSIIEPYLLSQQVFFRPGSEDDVCVRYLAEPGLRLVDVQDPVSYAIAIIDYPMDYYLVAYADGHVQTFEGEPPPELAETEER